MLVPGSSSTIKIIQESDNKINNHLRATNLGLNSRLGTAGIQLVSLPTLMVNHQEQMETPLQCQRYLCVRHLYTS